MNPRLFFIAVLNVLFLQSCGLKGPLMLPAPTNHLSSPGQISAQSCILRCGIPDNQGAKP